MMKSFLFLVTCLFYLPSADAQWQHVSGATYSSISSFAALDDVLFATTQDTWPIDGGIGVIRSTDNGSTWQIVTSDPSLKQTSALAIIGDTIFVGAGFQGTVLFKSSDSGNTWAQVQNTGMPEKLSTIRSIGNVMLGAGTSVAIKRSTDNGKSWNASTTGLESGFIECLATNGKIVFAGESSLGQGLYFSTDLGISWRHSKNMGLTDTRIVAVGVFDTVILAITGDGLVRSLDTGNTWTVVQAAANFKSFVSANHIYFVCGYDGFKFSTDNGETWTFQNGGWSESTTIPALFIHDNYLYAGTGGRGIWRRKLSEFSDVKNNTDDGSHSIQNYPNPFTGNTTITFALQTPSEVSVSIIDNLGKEISLLRSKPYSAGEHSIEWDANNYPSGIYSCQITADGVNETRKMILMK